MPEPGPQQIAKWLLVLGLMIAASGAAVLLLERFGFFKLPGDINISGRNWRIWFPITSCILVSIILTLILWLVSYLRR